MVPAVNNLSTGMSGWEIAGIAVGALIFVVLVVLAVSVAIARLGSRPRDYGTHREGPGRA